MSDMEQWPEIQKALSEKRRELVLQGPAVDGRMSAHGGLSSAVFSLTLLNYLEVSQCPSVTEIHDDIQRLSNLQSLILCRNRLRCVPGVVGQLKALKVLDVSANSLTVLPAGVTQLRELTTLNVSCNRLEELPDGLSQCTKLSTINVSKNQISRFPEDLFSPRLELLSSLEASENLLECLSGDVHKLAALKVLDLSNNKLKEIPPDLSNCPKLKEINFKGNKLNDKRLEKMVNGCQTKSILDYLRTRARQAEGGGGGGGGEADAGRGKADKGKQKRGKKKEQQEEQQEEQEEELNKMVVRILHVADSPAALRVTVSAGVKDVRPYLVCCVVRGMNLKPGNALKRFLMAQTKLHDDVCGKRTTATIATHDVQLLKSPLTYDVRAPAELKVAALGRKEMTAVELIRLLQLEADELRKHKKRQNVAGLHKYLQILQGKAMYPCLVDADGHVISFPPITNSEKTKIRRTSSELFLEVTSAASLQTCKDVMDALIAKMAELNRLTAARGEEAGSEGEGDGPADTPAGAGEASGELLVQQVRTVDPDGNLKVVYPSKNDLCRDISNLKIVW